MSRQLIVQRLYAVLGRLLTCVAANPQLCLRMFLWRVALPFLKYIVPMKTLARLMWASPRREGDHRAARVQAILEVWRRGGRLLVSGNCFERSLLLYRLLSREGAKPSLMFGVDRRAGGVAGHAWVELGGHVVLDNSVHAYERVVIFGVEGRPAEISC